MKKIPYFLQLKNKSVIMGKILNPISPSKIGQNAESITHFSPFHELAFTNFFSFLFLNLAHVHLVDQLLGLTQRLVLYPLMEPYINFPSRKETHYCNKCSHLSSCLTLFKFIAPYILKKLTQVQKVY